ncbi:hypothetical protein KC340_g126 [Hortaea werneckii]|nr:hypothetical protein KC340_g126 [Hortaea werneckii]
MPSDECLSSAIVACLEYSNWSGTYLSWEQQLRQQMQGSSKRAQELWCIRTEVKKDREEAPSAGMASIFALGQGTKTPKRIIVDHFPTVLYTYPRIPHFTQEGYEQQSTGVGVCPTNQSGWAYTGAMKQTKLTNHGVNGIELGSKPSSLLLILSRWTACKCPNGLNTTAQVSMMCIVLHYDEANNVEPDRQITEPT